MLIVKETAAGTFEEILPGSSFVGSDGNLNGWQCAELWTDAELDAIGVHRVQPVAPPPDPDTQITGYHFERSAGSIIQVLEIALALPLTKAQLAAYAAAKRFYVEVGGIVSPTFGALMTDRDTRAIIAQTIQSIDLGIVQAPVNFKTANGFVPLDRAAFVGIATAIVGHVQSTFDKEGLVDIQINDGTITTKAEVDAAFTA